MLPNPCSCAFCGAYDNDHFMLSISWNGHMFCDGDCLNIYRKSHEHIDQLKNKLPSSAGSERMAQFKRRMETQ